MAPAGPYCVSLYYYVDYFTIVVNRLVEVCHYYSTREVWRGLRGYYYCYYVLYYYVRFCV